MRKLEKTKPKIRKKGVRYFIQTKGEVQWSHWAEEPDLKTAQRLLKKMTNGCTARIVKETTIVTEEYFYNS